ncbi:hypothetical protein BUALT_BualtUnG0002700 [Buddleja alternifolia]|uniref:Uncharacterized protein n=1 Tax=Buddleja alternifolia TaxID=168488 RepID=A0AAV6W426_9LAMI|nr:hypothetical protein BUALT_BualtUnG0002700 [Buddleja alternifolia]
MELLEKFRIHTKDANEILRRVVEDPVTRHLPANSRIIGISKNSQRLVDVADYVNATSDDLQLVFAVGISTIEEVNQRYADDIISGYCMPSAVEDNSSDELHTSWDFVVGNKVLQMIGFC